MENFGEAELEQLFSEYVSGTIGDTPLYVISGSGQGWFLDPELYQMVPMSRGTEIIPIEKEADSENRILVRAPFRFLLISKKEIQEIGWN